VISLRQQQDGHREPRLISSGQFNPDRGRPRGKTH